MKWRSVTWGSQSWLQPPFEAAPRATTETDPRLLSRAKRPPERRLQPGLAAPRAPSSNKGILAGGGCHESRDQRMRRIPQRPELRLKQRAEEKDISGKLNGPDLAARGAGDAQTRRFEPLPIRGVQLV